MKRVKTKLFNDKCLKLLEEEEIRKRTPEKYKVFRYFYLKGKSPEDIAEELNCLNRTTIRRRASELIGIEYCQP